MSLLEKASLICTPNAYKTSKLYSVVPSAGTGDMDVVRATTATRVNASGLIESVGVNIPRIDYTNGSCPSLLVEPQRTNLITYSEQFDNEVWQKRSNIAITVNAITAPDGTLTADKMYLSNNLIVDYGCFQIVTSGTNRTLSVYAKKAELNYLFLGFNNDTASEGVFFNLNNGTISQNTGSFTASIENFSNGWYRCSVLFPSISYCFISPSVTGTSFVFNNQINNGIYIWGAQLEAGSYATSYIPTVASSVTRNADVISKTGISSLIGQTEGTMFLDFYAKNNNTVQILSQLRNVSGTAQIDLRWADGGLYALGNNNGANQFYLSVGSISVGSRYKVAIAYKLNDVKIYMNGTNVNSDTAATFLDQSMSYFSFAENLSSNIEAQFINSAQLYKTRLTNSELALLTTI